MITTLFHALEIDGRTFLDFWNGRVGSCFENTKPNAVAFTLLMEARERLQLILERIPEDERTALLLGLTIGEPIDTDRYSDCIDEILWLFSRMAEAREFLA